MSLASTIKDFVDVLNDIYITQIASTPGITSSISDAVNSQSSNAISITGLAPTADTASLTSEIIRSVPLPRTVVMQQAFFYTIKGLGNGIVYLLTFQWLKDLSYLPLLAPSEGRGIFFSDTDPVGGCTTGLCINHLLGLNDRPGIHLYYQLLAGFVNSFFFSLPLSLPHLVTVRRLFSQGITAAAAAIFGTVAAHSLLLIGVLYGLRFLIVPYHSLQPLTFAIGLFTMALLINEMIQDKKLYLAPLKELRPLLRIGVLNFVLALCEETTVFHSFHNLTLNANTSYLQLSASSKFWSLFLNNTSYVVAFVIGHFLFSLAFCYAFLKANEILCSLSGSTLPKMARRINRIVLLLIVALTFSSFPYYGLDYLFTKIGGFLPEDPILNRTIFSPTMVKSRGMHFKSRAPLTKNDKTPLELDLNYFDRGVYLNAPKEEKEGFSRSDTSDPEQSSASFRQENPNSDRPLTFEELNYQSEYAWLTRDERTRRLPEEGEGKKDLFFQEPKNHFKTLRLQNEKRQAEAALKEKKAPGHISGWKEGLVLGQRTNKDDSFYKSSICMRRNSEQSEALLDSFLKNKVDDQDGSLLTKPNLESKYVTKGTNLQRRDANLRSNEIQDQSDTNRRFVTPRFEEELADSYAKGFASSLTDELEGTPLDLVPVENIIKKRYLLNPVYRALLKSDIDSFLARQPSSYNMAHNQEHSLFTKRQLLERYYNWLRYYSPLEYNLHRTKNTADLFDRQNEALHTKSFVERVYHQQFKGTLHRAKRLFQVSFDSEQNPSKERVLSYDQTLYKNCKKTCVANRRFASPSHLPKKEFNRSDTSPSLHEELLEEKISPFIEESTSFPIYAGWDDKTHKFILTNRFSGF